MTPTPCQRWNNRRDSYRPAGEPINPAAYAVDLIASDAVAREFVTAHHYSGSYPAARFRFALTRAEQLVGVAVFSEGVQPAALRDFPEPGAAVELGRLVMLDDVPANGETWFIARCFEQLARLGVEGVLSLSDPMPRTRAAGDVVFGGHVGIIYQAHNALYFGRATPRTLRLMPDGTSFSARAWQKLRKGERGWRYAAAQLVAAGAERPPEDMGKLAAWASSAVRAVTRPARHAGNHRYMWGLRRSVTRHLERRARQLAAEQLGAGAERLPYPKIIDAPRLHK